MANGRQDEASGGGESSKALALVTWLLDRAIEGVPPLASAKDLSAEYLIDRSYKTNDHRVRTLIRWEATKNFTAGFVTGFGGLLTPPVTVPAALGASWVLQGRLAGAIAALHGHSLVEDRVRTLVLLAVLGDSGKETVKRAGVAIGKKLTAAAINKVPGRTLIEINKQVGFRLLTKAGPDWCGQPREGCADCRRRRRRLSRCCGMFRGREGRPSNLPAGPRGARRLKRSVGKTTLEHHERHNALDSCRGRGVRCDRSSDGWLGRWRSATHLTTGDAVTGSQAVAKTHRPEKGTAMSHRLRRGEENFLAMTVHNIGFLLDRLGQDCHPLQYLRELTQNSIEAILRSGVPGEIVWDVDWTAFDLDGIQKLCVADTGDGMTGDEMVRFINQLSSSVSAQSLSGNYGVGAKITAATRNVAGVLYLSWKRAEGAMIHLYRDKETGQYGLKQWRHQDGSYAHFLPLEDDVRPEMIEGHGTKVVLLGEHDDSNTMQAPPNTPSPSRWISKYLNTRYHRFPEGTTVRAREGWEYPRSDKDRNYLRTLTGQEPYLAQHCVASGTSDLTDAVAHWWILKDEPAISNNSGFIESAGHVGALYQDELYELVTARGGMSRLQQFGVIFGYRYVVIYVEPQKNAGLSLTTNTSRTSLLVNNAPLPWADWAAEFREKLPPEIAELVAEKASAASNTDHSKSIRDRLREILDLFKISRYRPTPGGTALIDEERLVRGGRVTDFIRESHTSGEGGKTGGAGGGAGNVYAVFEKSGGAPGKKIKPDPFPVVKWVTVKNGTREYGDIEDRAAKYHADQNLLLVNADFRVFADMVAFFVKQFGDVAGIEDLARDAVQGWFEQALVETVMGVQGLMSSKEWSQTQIDAAFSEEALTTAVMQRYHVHFAVKRELASKLGSRRSQAAG